MVKRKNLVGNQLKTKLLKNGVIISLLFICIFIVPQSLYALDSSEILGAANTVGSKSATDYQKALVLRYFDKIKGFREENKINEETFQKTMEWFRITHLQIAIKAASNKGFTAVEQQVSNDAAEYRVRSDTDILLSRKNGMKPITLEDVQAVEREHRRLLKAMTRKLAKNAKKSIDISGDFKTDTDFMVPPDLTTPTEFERLNRYFNAKGSATYRRPDAARVEAKIRDNKLIGIKEGSQYVDEMIEQVDNAKSPKGREKYIRRINELHKRLMQQVGLTLSAEDRVSNTTFAKNVLKSHIKILGEVVNSANSTPKDRQHARFLIALKLYDLPNTEKNSLLKKLPSQFRKEVKNEIKKFKEEAPNKSEVSRVQSFLQKTAGGRKLLAKNNWVFKELTKELTKEKGQRNNTASIADVTSSLLKTSRYVGNYAHSLNLWINLIRQVRDAKTDADLAIALGKTLASKTYYGMIADQLYTSVTELTEGNLTNAATGAVKFVTLWLCPEVAIPEVVQSIGDSAIDITSSILFDKQFMALYLASTFDPENGTLLSIGGYKGKAPVCQFIDDALIPGAHSLISGVFDEALKLAKKKNLSVDVVSGINALGKRALIKAISSTIYNGEPLVLQDYQPLASSCSNVAKLTNNINDFTEGLGYDDTIPRNVKAPWLDEVAYFQNLEPAAKRPLKSLLRLRSDAWQKVKNNLCAGITKNIFNRHQAELALNKDSGKEAERLRKRIEIIFNKLKIYTFGMKRLEADGATNIIMRNFVTSTKDQQIKAMQALQRYLVNYKRVLAYRQQAEAYFKFLTGQSLIRRPLTITPPLAVEPEFDAKLASSYMEEILSSVSRIQKSWLQTKRKALNDNEAELDSNFDKDILKKYYIEIFSHAYAATVMKGSSRALNPPSTALGLPLRIVTGELFKDLRYHNLHDIAFKTTQETWEKRKKLDTEFKSHYQNIKMTLSINLPVEIKNGQGIVGSEYFFNTKTVNIPDEAAFTWLINDKKIATGDSMEHSFEEAGKYQLRVIASWKKSERITNEGSIEAKANFQIKKFEKPEGRTDTGDINKDKSKDNKNTGDRVKSVSTSKPEENNGIEKKWIISIEDAYTKNGWKKLLELHTQLVEANRQKYHSLSITQSPYLAPAKLLGKYLKEFAQIKWDWFKKDVPSYLRRLESQSEGKYAALERKVTKILLERNGTQEEADKCLEDAKKEVRATRKLIRQAKKEHAVVAQKMFDNQGNPVKILTLVKDFLVKYKIPENLKVSVSYSSTCVGKSDENATKKLKVKISGAKTITMSPKETVTLNAKVTGGKAPVNISWEGENISPSGSRVIFTASRPGTYTVQVTAKDANGQSVSDSVTVKIRESIEPELFGLSDTVYYGKTYPITVGISAQEPKKNKPLQDDPCKGHKQTQNPFDPCNKIIIDRDSKGNKVREYVPDPSKEGPYDVPPIEETAGEYEYIWQPAGGDGLEFDLPSSSIPKVNVTFGNIGEIEIWAEIHKNGEKVGETKRIKTTVIPPNFTLNISPAAPYVGGESKATIDISPDIDNKYLNFRWLPMGDNIQELGESKDGRTYRFKTKNKKSSKIEVLVWAEPYAEKQIADLKQVVSAKPYQVNVKVLGPLGAKPMIWKEGKGLVKVDREIAVYQNVRLEAIITPEPKDTSLRYSWKLNEDSHFAGGESGKEVMLNRSQTGACIATVTVTDKDGNVLGKGSGSFSVSISQKQIDSGKQEENDQKKAQELLKKGRVLWKEGKLKQAIAKIAQAQKLAEKDKEIAKILKAMQIKKKDLESKLKEAVESIKKGKLQKAKEMLSKAARVNDKYPKYTEVLKQLSDAKRRATEKKKKLDILLQDAKALNDAGKLSEAVAILKKGSKAFPTNKEIRKLLKDVQKQQSDAHTIMNDGQSKWRKGLLVEAISTLKKAAKIDPLNKQITKSLKSMQAQKKTMDNALKKAAKQIKQKKLKQASRALKKAEHISSNYSPYVEILKKLERAKKKKENEKLAKELLNKAKDYWNAGRLSNAIAVLVKDSKQLAKNKKIKQALQKMQKDKKTIDSELGRADNLIGQKKITEAESVLKQAGEISSNYLPYISAMTRLNLEKEKIKKEKKKQADAQTQMTEGQMQWKNGMLGKAVLTLQKAASIDPSNKQIIKVLKAMQSQKKTIDNALKKADQFVEQKKFKQVKGELKKAQRISSNYPPYIKLLEKLDSAKREAEQGIPQPNPEESTKNKPVGNIASLIGSWEFGRSKHYGKPVQEHLCNLTLIDEFVEGIGYKIKSCHPNESYWVLEGKTLLFVAQDGTITTKFTQVRPNYWRGAYVGSAHSSEDLLHYLKRLGSTDEPPIKPYDTSVNSQGSLHVGTGVKRTPGGAIRSGKGIRRNLGEPVSALNGTDSLTLPKKGFEPGEKIVLKFTASPNYPEQSWIGMFKADLPHEGMDKNNNKELTFKYLEKKASGTFEFIAPIKEGDYDFRMFERNNGKEVVTIGFNVKVDKNAASLTLAKKVYEPGEKIVLQFTASPNYPEQSWIGMFKADLPHEGMDKNNNKELVFKYLEKKASGTFEFIAPTKEGDYDFRMFEKSNGKEVVTIGFNIKVDKNVASLTLPKKVFEPGEKIVLKFTASPNYPELSWIGMFNGSLVHGNLAQVNNKELAYEYIKGKSSGSFEFTAPKKEGEYDFRMLETSNGLEVATVKFKVRKLPSSVTNGKGNSTRGKEEAPKNKVKEQTIRTTFNSPSQGNVENTGSSIRHGSDETPTANNPTNGYWKLSNTIIYTDPDINSHECYKSLISLKNGSLSAITSVYKRDCNWHFDESITFTGSWTPPSSVLLPGKSYPMHINIRRSNPVKQWGADNYISLYMDNYDTGCGSATRSALDITNEWIKVYWRSSNPSSNSWSGSFVAPAYGYSDSGKTNKFQIKATVRDGCVRYIYQWVPKDSAAAKKRTNEQAQAEKKAALAEKIHEITVAAKERAEADNILGKDQKKISVEQFMGTLSGTWSGKGIDDWKGWTSNGTFIMHMSKNGKISGRYSGDDKGKLSGSVSRSGKLNVKSGGGSAGTGSWSGSITIEQGKLKGHGRWSVDGFIGTWHGTGQ